MNLNLTGPFKVKKTGPTGNRVAHIGYILPSVGKICRLMTFSKDEEN